MIKTDELTEKAFLSYIENLKPLAYALVSAKAKTNGIGTGWHLELDCYAIQINLVEDAVCPLPDSFEGVPIIYKVIGEAELRCG